MRSFLADFRQPLFDTPLARRVMHTLHAASNRRLLARLDREDACRRQTRTLLTLVHHARRTPFGRDHDFGRIRTPLDFRRLVPLQRPSARPAPWYEVGFLAHRHALSLALALVQGSRPASICWLGDDPLAADRFPCLVRPAVFEAATLPQDASPTCLVGPAERVVAYCRDRTYPSSALRAVLYSRDGPKSSVEALREAVGPEATLIELVGRPEGPIAVEDPRFGSLRLLANAGVYFEFVSARQAQEANPPRLGLDEVHLGVPYELILTAPASLWARRTGLTIVFDRLDPPLVRILTPLDPAVSVRGDAAAQAPHRSSIYIPAALPETFVHTPWSTPADRG